ncbi:bifunctional tetrahydrofolate synthase/dihydrofolate synthase [Thiofilum flexile]|uniref:bifunctional tetrahydrofolate synthase/dihydrofolate synthase n=1 Tax=Thiofilum flexile TaxID=125627 RepID=UPI00036E9E4D|nr:bifunctional tetrahydrofolate synthase/dihydrofolate synthase [Thiofilum flexile]
MKTLADWLAWQESQPRAAIQLGLERVAEVATRLGLSDLPFPVITVAGTNGKGSTCAMLTACLVAAGYQVGTYTSPHIQAYNERIALNGHPASDALIVEAFEAIEAARGEIHLTYFEFGTLAAVYCFVQQSVDIAVLEVGLGGRLDAVNIWDAEIAIVTSIGIDHVEWLGSDRESIGAEKAAIARQGKYLISGDPNPPASIQKTANAKGALVLQYGADFKVLQTTAQDFRLSTPQGIEYYPLPALLGEVQQLNAALVIMALQRLGVTTEVKVGLEPIRQGLRQVQLMGRLQPVSVQPPIWIDVAHNGHAAQSLASWLKTPTFAGQTHAVFSILADKDLVEVANTLAQVINTWHVFALVDKRALPLNELVDTLEKVNPNAVIYAYSDLASALKGAINQCNTRDRVVAFGSFLVVSGVLKHFSPNTL